jgi:hypothetical protein
MRDVVWPNGYPFMGSRVRVDGGLLWVHDLHLECLEYHCEAIAHNAIPPCTAPKIHHLNQAPQVARELLRNYCISALSRTCGKTVYCGWFESGYSAWREKLNLERARMRLFDVLHGSIAAVAVIGQHVFRLGCVYGNPAAQAVSTEGNNSPILSGRFWAPPGTLAWRSWLRFHRFNISIAYQSSTTYSVETLYAHVYNNDSF